MVVIDPVTVIGLMGAMLVFTSFIMKKWVWLYSLNLSGATLLLINAYLTKNLVFLVLQSGIVALLSYRLIRELKFRKR